MLDTVKINHVQHISFTQSRLTDAVSVILSELLSYEHPSKHGSCFCYRYLIFYLSIMLAWNSCRDCTGSLPSRFAERMPSTVAFAAAMVVIYGIRFLMAALRM